MKKLPERRCIVTQDEYPKEELIRFVLGPAGEVVPDIRNKLPGRGVWVSPGRGNLKKAIEKGGFAKGFKSKVTADLALIEQVEALLEQAMLRLLGMAKKSGSLVIGQSNVLDAIKSGETGLLFLTKEASEEGKRKLISACEHNKGIELAGDLRLHSNAFDQVLGGVNIMYVLVNDPGFCDRLKPIGNKLSQYRE